MHICFVEDTHLHGGTQIWVSEAIRDFLDKGHEVTLLTPSGGFNATNDAGRHCCVEGSGAARTVAGCFAVIVLYRPRSLGSGSRRT
jgi:hypothetical protein